MVRLGNRLSKNRLFEIFLEKNRFSNEVFGNRFDFDSISIDDFFISNVIFQDLSHDWTKSNVKIQNAPHRIKIECPNPKCATLNEFEYQKFQNGPHGIKFWILQIQNVIHFHVFLIQKLPVSPDMPMCCISIENQGVTYIYEFLS